MDKMESLNAKYNGKLQESERSLGLSHYGAPLCMATYDQNYHITPNFSQYNACNGSFSDMLLPARYNDLLEEPSNYSKLLLEEPSKYSKLLDDLLIVEEPLVQQPSDLLILEEPSKYSKLLDDLLLIEEPLLQQPISKPQTNQGQHASPFIKDIDVIYSHHSNNDFAIDDSIVIPVQQLSAPITVNVNHDANNVLPPLPPLAPLALVRHPLHTGRPPLRKGTPSYRDNHIHSERQRRQDMTSLFNKLRSILPNMHHDDFKMDRCTTVGQAIEYVQELDKKVEALGKRKAELLMQAKEPRKKAASAAGVVPAEIVSAARSSSMISVSVRFCGPMDIFITLNCPKQRGLWPDLLGLLQDTLPLHIHNVTFSSTPLFCVHFIYAKVVGITNDELCCDKLQNILTTFVANHAQSSLLQF